MGVRMNSSTVFDVNNGYELDRSNGLKLDTLDGFRWWLSSFRVARLETSLTPMAQAIALTPDVDGGRLVEQTVE